MDTLTKEQRSRQMGRIKGKNTKPELRVRKLIHRAGHRYRLHRKELPGKPDLVFPSKRKVIFVHGCFWHAHSKPTCKKARIPKTNQNFWRDKFAANAARDRRNVEILAEMGWKVLTLWECELTDDKTILEKAEAFLNEND